MTPNHVFTQGLCTLAASPSSFSGGMLLHQLMMEMGPPLQVEVLLLVEEGVLGGPRALLGPWTAGEL